MVRLLFLIGLVLSCASKEQNKGYEFDEEKRVDVPVWVYAPQETCDVKKYLCASSEADSFDGADTKAVAGIAEIFSSSIDLKSSVEKKGETSIETKAALEKFSSKISKRTKSILKGVKIAQRFRKDKSFYSLAQLDKKPASKIMKAKLKNLDNKLIELHDRGNKTVVPRLLELYHDREELASALSVLDIPFRKSPISLKEIFYIKNAGEALVYIETKGEQVNEILSMLKDILVDSGIKFVTDKKLATSIVIAELVSTQKYLNVKGFKRFESKLTIKTIRANKTVGLMGVSVTANGRSVSDSLSKSKYEIKKQVRRKIDQLNIK